MITRAEAGTDAKASTQVSDIAVSKRLRPLGPALEANGLRPQLAPEFAPVNRSRRGQGWGAMIS